MKKFIKATILIILTILLAIMLTSCSQMDAKTRDDIVSYLAASFAVISLSSIVWACWEASKDDRNGG